MGLDARSHNLGTAYAPGAADDLTLLRTADPELRAHVWVVADGGYLGYAKNHQQGSLPVWTPRGAGATTGVHNRSLTRFQVTVEHAIRSLEIWRILKGSYRNCRKRFSLRFKPIAGPVNAQLGA